MVKTDETWEEATAAEVARQRAEMQQQGDHAQRTRPQKRRAAGRRDDAGKRAAADANNAKWATRRGRQRWERVAAAHASLSGCTPTSLIMSPQCQL